MCVIAPLTYRESHTQTSLALLYDPGLIMAFLIVLVHQLNRIVLFILNESILQDIPGAFSYEKSVLSSEVCGVHVSSENAIGEEIMVLYEQTTMIS